MGASPAGPWAFRGQVFSVATTRLATVLELGALTIGSTYTFRLTASAGVNDATAVSGFSAVSVVIVSNLCTLSVVT